MNFPQNLAEIATSLHQQPQVCTDNRKFALLNFHRWTDNQCNGSLFSVVWTISPPGARELVKEA